MAVPSSHRRSPTITGYSPAGPGTGITLGAALVSSVFATDLTGALAGVFLGVLAFLLVAFCAGADFLAGAFLGAGAAIAVVQVNKAKGRAVRSFFMVERYKESVKR